MLRAVAAHRETSRRICEQGAAAGTGQGAAAVRSGAGRAPAAGTGPAAAAADQHAVAGVGPAGRCPDRGRRQLKRWRPELSVKGRARFQFMVIFGDGADILGAVVILGCTSKM